MARSAQRKSDNPQAPMCTRFVVFATVTFAALFASGCGVRRCRELHDALDRGDTHSAIVAMEHGASPTCRFGPDGYTAIHRAAARGRVEALRAMMDYRAPLNELDDETRTPLFVATRENQYDAATFLLARGADVHAGRTCCRETALHSAARHANPRLATLLLDHGADVNAGDRTNQTALMLAADEPDAHAPEVVAAILAHGGDPDLHSDRGATALIVAAHRGDEAIATQLLAAGALVNATDADGLTAWDHADLTGHLAVVRLLEAHGGRSARHL